MDIILDRPTTNGERRGRNATPFARKETREGVKYVRSAALDVPARSVARAGGHPGSRHRAWHGDVHQEFRRDEELVHRFLKERERGVSIRTSASAFASPSRSEEPPPAMMKGR
jgi:hypothetical protein